MGRKRQDGGEGENGGGRDRMALGRENGWPPKRLQAREREWMAFQTITGEGERLHCAGEGKLGWCWGEKMALRERDRMGSSSIPPHLQAREQRRGPERCGGRERMGT